MTSEHSEYAAYANGFDAGRDSSDDEIRALRALLRSTRDPLLRLLHRAADDAEEREVRDLVARVDEAVREEARVQDVLRVAAERDALAGRVGDAELLLRAMFDAELNSRHPLDWYFKDGHTIVFPGRFTLSFDRERGLPVLTDEARAALRGEGGR